MTKDSWTAPLEVYKPLIVEAMSLPARNIRLDEILNRVAPLCHARPLPLLSRSQLHEFLEIMEKDGLIEVSTGRTLEGLWSIKKQAEQTKRNDLEMKEQMTAPDTMELRLLYSELAHSIAVCAAKEIAMLAEHPEWADLLKERRVRDARAQSVESMKKRLKETYGLSDGDTIDVNTGGITRK